MSTELTCQECGRRGNVKPKVVDLGDHLAAIEETENGMLIQWQKWSGHWFCHSCLADHVGGPQPEDVQ